MLNIPRDRNSNFEPQLIPKGQRMSDKLEEAIIGMYSRGMTTSDISEQVKQAYGVDVSEGTISNVTNKIIEQVKEWQNRPLEQVYFAVWMDGIVLKVRQNGKYINKMYSVSQRMDFEIKILKPLHFIIGSLILVQPIAKKD